MQKSDCCHWPLGGTISFVKHFNLIQLLLFLSSPPKYSAIISNHFFILERKTMAFVTVQNLVPTACFSVLLFLR